jgi:hypothetical protein
MKPLCPCLGSFIVLDEPGSVRYVDHAFDNPLDMIPEPHRIRGHSILDFLLHSGFEILQIWPSGTEPMILRIPANAPFFSEPMGVKSRKKRRDD